MVLAMREEGCSCCECIQGPSQNKGNAELLAASPAFVFPTGSEFYHSQDLTKPSQNPTMRWVDTKIATPRCSNSKFFRGRKQGQAVESKQLHVLYLPTTGSTDKTLGPNRTDGSKHALYKAC